MRRGEYWSVANHKDAALHVVIICVYKNTILYPLFYFFPGKCHYFKAQAVYRQIKVQRKTAMKIFYPDCNLNLKMFFGEQFVNSYNVSIRVFTSISKIIGKAPRGRSLLILY